MTERGSRRTLPGLGGAGREAAARDTRGPNAPSLGPGSPGRQRSPSLLSGASLHSSPGPSPSPWQPPTLLPTPHKKRQKPRATASSQSPGPAVSCPRGQGFPLPAAGRRRRAADPAGIPEPASACGRPSAAGGEGRAGEFPPARPANAATASGPRASAGPAARRPTRSRLAGEGRPGHPVAIPRERQEERQTDKRARGRLSPLPRSRCPRRRPYS